MSWRVDGQYYHNWAEYQNALARSAQRRAEEEAGSLRLQFERQQERIRETESQLRSAQDNYQLQMDLNARLGRQIEEIHRTQRQLQETQESIEREMVAGFEAARQHFAQTDAQLAELSRDHQAHVETMRKEFAATHDAIARGLNDAEERRAEMDRRLRAAISEVDRKIESDRQERVRQADGDLSRASGLADMARELTAPCAARAEALDLQAELHGIDEQLEAVRRQIEQQNAPAALAAAEAAFSASRKLVFQRAEREARLTDAKRQIEEVVTQGREELESDLVKACFASERTGALTAIDLLERRGRERYARYDRLAVRAEEDERLMGQLSEEIRRMSSSAPEVQRLFQAREDRIDQVMSALQEACGELIREPERKYARSTDPKSNCVIRCEFASGKIDLHVPLDRDARFTIDAYGQNSDKACDLQFRRVMTQLERHSLISRSEADGILRIAPRVNVGDQAPVAAWQNMERRLQQLGEDAK